MYIKFKNITIWEIDRWGKKFPNLQLNLCWLYKDDDTYIKWIEMNNWIAKLLENAKIDVCIIDVEYALKEHEISKLIPPPPPPPPNLFSHRPLKWLQPDSKK